MLTSRILGRRVAARLANVRPLKRCLSTGASDATVTSFFTDAEGNVDYFSRFTALSSVITMKVCQFLESWIVFNFRSSPFLQDGALHLKDNANFVYGGDCFDKGLLMNISANIELYLLLSLGSCGFDSQILVRHLIAAIAGLGDRRISTLLVDLKQKHPDRVHLILGSAEL